MKKQLLIAAVAATMTSVAIADVSITGSGKLNYTNVDNETAADTNAFGTDLALTITGKTGDTSVVITQEFNDQASAEPSLDGTQQGTIAMQTKAAYMKSNIAGVNVQAGSWISSDSLLGNGSIADGRFSADYTVEGVKIQYEAQNGSDSTVDNDSVTISGTVAGVSLSHEIHSNDNTDTKVSGSIGGVNIAYRTFDQDNETTASDQDKESLMVDYTTNGVTLQYAMIDNDNSGTTSSDDWFGTHTTEIHAADGFGLKTSIAGNAVQLRSYDIEETNGAADDSYVKMIVTRPLASGANLEVTYTDKDDAGTADSETLDLELNVKF